MGNQFSQVQTSNRSHKQRSLLSFNTERQSNSSLISQRTSKKSIHIKSFDQLEFQKNMFNFRLKHKQYLCYCYGFQIQNLKQKQSWSQLKLTCNQSYFSVKINFHFQQILEKFTDLYNLPLKQGFQLLRTVLIGFELLYEKFGYFLPQSKCIMKQGNQWKVWINDNIFILRTKILQKRNIENISKEKFLMQAIHLFDMLRDPQFPEFSYTEYIYGSNAISHLQIIENIKLEDILEKIDAQKIMGEFYGFSNKKHEIKTSLRRVSADSHQTVKRSISNLSNYTGKDKIIFNQHTNDATLPKFNNNKQLCFKRRSQSSHCTILNQKTNLIHKNQQKHIKHISQAYTPQKYQTQKQQQNYSHSNNKSFNYQNQRKHSKTSSNFSNNTSIGFKASIFKNNQNQHTLNSVKQNFKLENLQNHEQLKNRNIEILNTSTYQIKQNSINNQQFGIESSKNSNFQSKNRNKRSLSNLLFKNDACFKRVSSKLIHQYVAQEPSFSDNRQCHNNMISYLYNPTTAPSQFTLIGNNLKQNIRNISQPTSITKTLNKKNPKNHSTISTPSNCTKWTKQQSFTPIQNSLGRNQQQKDFPNNSKNINKIGNNNLCSNCSGKFRKKQRSFTVDLSSSSSNVNSRHQNDYDAVPKRITQNSQRNSQSQQNNQYYQDDQNPNKNMDFKQAFQQSQLQIQYDNQNSAEQRKERQKKETIQFISKNPTNNTPSIARNTKKCGQQTMKYLKQLLVNHSKYSHKRSFTDTNPDNKIKFCWSQEFDSAFFSTQSYGQYNNQCQNNKDNCQKNQQKQDNLQQNLDYLTKVQLNQAQQEEQSQNQNKDYQKKWYNINCQKTVNFAQDSHQQIPFTVQRNPNRLYTLNNDKQKSERRTKKVKIAEEGQQQHCIYQRKSDPVCQSAKQTSHYNHQSNIYYRQNKYEDDSYQIKSRASKQVSIAKLPIFKSQGGLKSLLTNKLSTLKSIKQIEVDIPIDQQILNDLNKMFTKHRFAKSTKLTR